MIAWGWGWQIGGGGREKIDYKGAGGNFEGDGYVHNHLDNGDDFRGIYVCQNSIF